MTALDDLTKTCKRYDADHLAAQRMARTLIEGIPHEKACDVVRKLIEAEHGDAPTAGKTESELRTEIRRLTNQHIDLRRKHDALLQKGTSEPMEAKSDEDLTIETAIKNFERQIEDKNHRLDKIEAEKENLSRELRALHKSANALRKVLGVPNKMGQPLPRPQTRSQGEYECRVDGCDEVKTTGQGRAGHERTVHGRNIAKEQRDAEAAA